MEKLPISYLSAVIFKHFSRICKNYKSALFMEAYLGHQGKKAYLGHQEKKRI